MIENGLNRHENHSSRPRKRIHDQANNKLLERDAEKPQTLSAGNCEQNVQTQNKASPKHTEATTVKEAPACCHRLSNLHELQHIS